VDLEAIFGPSVTARDTTLTGASPRLKPAAEVEAAETPPADDSVAFEAFVCRAIERDLGLPPGSFKLWDPIRSRACSAGVADGERVTPRPCRQGRTAI
jgi:hypothetical protein